MGPREAWIVAVRFGLLRLGRAVDECKRGAEWFGARILRKNQE